jgi:hypothetical protein
MYRTLIAQNQALPYIGIYWPLAVVSVLMFS